MTKYRLRITANGVSVFDMALDVAPVDAVVHAQEQVDVTAWANPGAKVVGELTAPGGGRDLLWPVGGVS